MKNLLKISSKNISFIALLIIFAILLLQSVLSLFFVPASDGIAQIDVVFRTSLSSIFGFIMSAVSMNFISKSIDSTEQTKINQIGFTPNSTNNDIKNRMIVMQDEKEVKVESITVSNPEIIPTKKIPLNYQIIVLSGICIFCLIIMIFVRNFSGYIIPDTASTVTLSIYRDFISASIGALIGFSKN